MDVSGDGNIVTIGSPFNDENNDKVGILRVYEFDIIDNRWVQRADLDSESENIFLGYHVSMSTDGIVIGING